MKRRSRGERKDPRNDDGMVAVSAYSKEDGTEVNEHRRSFPGTIKGKMKFEYPGRAKGKVTVYDENGKLIDKQKFNQELRRR